MKTDTKIILGTVIATILILLITIVYFSNDKTPQRENLGTASMTIDKKFEDFGTMKVDEDKTAVFTISNTSQDSTLRIWGISTSCNCTFASISINGQETEEFNMPAHMNKTLRNWIGEIPANQTATLKVTYKPKIMPVTGIVTRQTRFSTNDPKNPEIEVSVKANVL